MNVENWSPVLKCHTIIMSVDELLMLFGNEYYN